MKNYYTAVEIVEGNHVGVVYSSANNHQIYRTKPHTTGAQAMQEMHNFLATRIPTNTDQASNLNTSLQVKRCSSCGR